MPEAGGFGLTQGSFVPASVILQELHDQPPTGPVTLQWLMGRLRQQSFGMFVLILAIAAAAPGISFLAGFLLLVTSSQMMLGHSELRFPSWIAMRELPTRHVDVVIRRAIPILASLEKAIHPRLAIPPEANKRVVGVVVFVLTVRLLLAPLPLSNIFPAILIALISLTYLEEDGLLLVVALLVGGLFLVLDLGVTWQLIYGGKWILGVG